MTRKSLKWLLTIVAFAFLLLVGTVLPLGAASGPPTSARQGRDEVWLEIDPETITVTSGKTIIVDVIVHNGRAFRIVDVNLGVTAPSESVSTSLDPSGWQRVPPGGSRLSELEITASEEITDTITGALNLRYHEISRLNSPQEKEFTFTLLPAEAPSAQPSPEATETEEIPPAGEELTEEPTTEPSPGEPTTEITPTPEPGFLGGLWESLKPNTGTLALTVLLVLAALLALILVIVLLVRLFRKPKGKGRTQPLKPGARAPTAGPAHPYLALTGASGKTRRIPLEGEGLTIGRAAGNDLVIDKRFPQWETVSRNHARIYNRGGYWVFEDLDSTNGIYVDERRTGKNLLEEGRKLGIGGVTLTFHTGSGEASS